MTLEELRSLGKELDYRFSQDFGSEPASHIEWSETNRFCKSIHYSFGLSTNSPRDKLENFYCIGLAVKKESDFEQYYKDLTELLEILIRQWGEPVRSDIMKPIPGDLPRVYITWEHECIFALMHFTPKLSYGRHVADKKSYSKEHSFGVYSLWVDPRSSRESIEASFFDKPSLLKEVSEELKGEAPVIRDLFKGKTIERH